MSVAVASPPRSRLRPVTAVLVLVGLLLAAAAIADDVRQIHTRDAQRLEQRAFLAALHDRLPDRRPVGTPSVSPGSRHRPDRVCDVTRGLGAHSRRLTLCAAVVRHDGRVRVLALRPAPARRRR